MTKHIPNYYSIDDGKGKAVGRIFLSGGIVGLGTSGTEQIVKGQQGMTFDSPLTNGGTATINFSDPISQFGAYRGAATSTHPSQDIGDPAEFTVQSIDVFDALIDSLQLTYSRADQNADGVLEWHGWLSDVPIARLIYSEDVVVMDRLRATLVPEPSIILLYPLFAIPAVSLRDRGARAVKTR